MFLKSLILFLALFALNEAHLSDSLDFLTSLNLNLDEVLYSRVRRDADLLSSPKEDAIAGESPLTDLIKILSEHNFNVSIIGWQHVYDDTGNLVEVDTLELVIPIKDESNIDPLFDDSDEDFFDDRKNQQEILVSLDEFRVPTVHSSVDVFLQPKNPKNDLGLFHWNLSTVYFRSKDGLVTFNETKIATKEEIDRFAEALKKKQNLALEPLIVKYDVDGNVTLAESTLSTPSIVSYVVDAREVSDEILLESSKILADLIIAGEKDEIPELLAEKFNEKFGKYEWRVLVDPGEVYITKDLWIQLSWDGFEFYSGHKAVLYVYGILKLTNHT